MKYLVVFLILFNFIFIILRRTKDELLKTKLHSQQLMFIKKDLQRCEYWNRIITKLSQSSACNLITPFSLCRIDARRSHFHEGHTFNTCWLHLNCKCQRKKYLRVYEVRKLTEAFLAFEIMNGKLEEGRKVACRKNILISAELCILKAYKVNVLASRRRYFWLWIFSCVQYVCTCTICNGFIEWNRDISYSCIFSTINFL